MSIPGIKCKFWLPYSDTMSLHYITINALEIFKTLEVFDDLYDSFVQGSCCPKSKETSPLFG